MARRPKIKITCIDRLGNAPATGDTVREIPGILIRTEEKSAPWSCMWHFHT